jgi:hypothetical protein
MLVHFHNSNTRLDLKSTLPQSHHITNAQRQAPGFKFLSQRKPAHQFDKIVKNAHRKLRNPQVPSQSEALLRTAHQFHLHNGCQSIITSQTTTCSLQTFWDNELSCCYPPFPPLPCLYLPFIFHNKATWVSHTWWPIRNKVSLHPGVNKSEWLVASGEAGVTHT